MTTPTTPDSLTPEDTLPTDPTTLLQQLAAEREAHEAANPPEPAPRPQDHFTTDPRYNPRTLDDYKSRFHQAQNDLDKLIRLINMDPDDANRILRSPESDNLNRRLRDQILNINMRTVAQNYAEDAVHTLASLATTAPNLGTRRIAATHLLQLAGVTPQRHQYFDPHPSQVDPQPEVTNPTPKETQLPFTDDQLPPYTPLSSTFTPSFFLNTKPSTLTAPPGYNPPPQTPATSTTEEPTDVKPPEPVVAQDLSPDAAGLEPAIDAVAETPTPTRAKSPAPTPALRKNKFSLGDKPVTAYNILLLASPVVVEQLLSASIGLTDLVVAGHTGASPAEKTASAASVSMMTYVQWFVSLITSSLGVGATAIVARAIGAHRPRLANRVAGTVSAAAFLVGIAAALALFFGAGIVCYLFRLKGLAADAGIAYLQIMAWTVCFQTFAQIAMSCLRGAGDTFRPMLVTIAITLMNLLASPALSFGWFGLPKMGVRGNATGTLLSFIVAGAATAYFLLAGNAGIKLRLRHFRIIPHQLKRVLTIGIPSGLESMIIWSGQVLIVLFVMGNTDDALHLDGITIAAHGATLRIESLAFLPGFGIGIACSSLVGQYLGAKKPQQAQQAARLCIKLNLLIMSIAALPMVFLPRFMLSLLVDAGPVVALGTIPLILAGLVQPAFGVMITTSSVLKGAGETVSPMWASISGMILRVALVLPLAWYLKATGHANWGLIGVWSCICIDLTYRAFFVQAAYRRGRWLTKQV